MIRDRVRRVADAGFTLVELLLVVALTGLLVAVIGSAMVVGLRTTGVTAERLAESVDVQLLSTYLVPDVQSAGPLAGDVAAALSDVGCAAGGAPTDVLVLKWREELTANVPYEAAYRTVLSGADCQLVRYYDGPGGPEQRVLARQLDATAGVRATVTTTRIQVRLVLVSGYSSSVSAVRRTPLAPVAPGPVAPPASCVVLPATVMPSTVTRTTTGTLLSPVTVSVQTSGPTCGAVSVSYVKAPITAPGVVTTQALVRASASAPWTGSLQPSGWEEGTAQLDFSEPGTALGNLLLIVDTAAPCAVVGPLVVTPASAGLSGASPSTLTAPGTVTVEVVTNAFCATLTLRYDPSTSTAPGTPATPSAASLAFSPLSATSWRAVVPATQSWTSGAHPLVVREGAPSGTGAILAATTFTATTAPCSVTSITVSPNPNPLSGSKNLSEVMVVRVATAGVCATPPQISFTPGNASSTLVSLDMAADGPGQWRLAVNPNTYTWSTGAKVIDVRLGGDPAATTTLIVG